MVLFSYMGVKVTPELIKNLSDPNWRIRNLYYIKTKQGKVELFNPNRCQEDFLERDEGKAIILKARQMGMSTLCLLRLLDQTIFNQNTTSVILAHTRESVQKLFKIIKFAYEQYPKGMPKPKAKYDTKNELYFEETNSTIYVSTGVRGDTINNLHVSELAFMEQAEDKLIATFAAVVPGGVITIESTANGVGNFFYDFFHEASERGFQSYFYPWFWAKEYATLPDGIEFTDEERAYQERYGVSEEQLAWYRHNKNLLKSKFVQEYPSNPEEAFIASGGTVFPLEELDQMVTKEAQIASGEGLHVWDLPQYRHSYCMGVDVAEGIGKDESSIDIIDINTGEQVWHWSGNTPIPLLAEKIETAAKKYNNAYIIPEANNHGFALIHMLKERGLRIYKREKLDGPFITRSEKLGWQTNKRTKPLMVQDMVNALYDRDVKIYHKKTLAQMRTYIIDSETGSMNAAPGKKDDTVISMCLAWQGVRMAPSEYRESVDSFDFSPIKGEGMSAIAY